MGLWKSRSIKRIKLRLGDRPIECLSTEYKGSRADHLWKCKMCGKTWESTPNSVLNEDGGCPYCGTDRTIKANLSRGLRKLE